MKNDFSHKGRIFIFLANVSHHANIKSTEGIALDHIKIKLTKLIELYINIFLKVSKKFVKQSMVCHKARSISTDIQIVNHFLLYFLYPDLCDIMTIFQFNFKKQWVALAAASHITRLITSENMIVHNLC